MFYVLVTTLNGRVAKFSGANPEGKVTLLNSNLTIKSNLELPNTKLWKTIFHKVVREQKEGNWNYSRRPEVI